MSTDRIIVAVHGGGVLPEFSTYLQLWRDALRAGLERDAPKKLGKFDDTEIVMPWVGDELAELHKPVDAVLDLADRQSTLAELSDVTSTKSFRRMHYERLPGKSAFAEFVADVASPALGVLGLGGTAVEKAVPELKAYWQKESALRTRWHAQLRTLLEDNLSKDKSILLISHGVGCVSAWDVLWQLGQERPDQKLGLWLTLGAPLANNSVRKRLAGAAEKSVDRYPANLMRWHNISAEDDFLCHDKTVADDFAPMLRERRISEVVDHHIYNLAVRYGRSSPGHSTGYLVHPRTAEVLANWLKS